MRTDAKTARKIGALYFDENTILEVKQLGGGGSGVGGANGLNARNLVTGEDTGEVIAAQAGQIEEQGAQIDALTAQNTELQTENVRLQDANAELTERLEEAEAAAGLAFTYKAINNTNTRVLGPSAPAGNISAIAAGNTATAGTILTKTATGRYIIGFAASAGDVNIIPTAKQGFTVISRPYNSITFELAADYDYNTPLEFTLRNA